MRRAESRRQKSEDRSQNAGTPGRFRSSSRPRSSPVSCLLSPVFRAAFSLLELMIAIVILGIGMVMVATIFPIGIDMAAQTVQINIAQAVADAAWATLKLKVPPYSTILNPGAQSHVVIAADVTHTDLDTQIDDVDDVALTASRLSTGVDWVTATDPWSVDTSLNLGSGRTIDAYKAGLFPTVPTGSPRLDKLRYFTERTGWAGETGSSGVGDAWDYAYVMPSQNLPPVYMLGTNPRYGNMESLPAMIPPTLGRQPDLHCLSLADCVYPPVDVSKYTLEGCLRTLALDRRYSWIAIHRITDPSLGGARFFITLLITHRGDMNARYARQKAPSGSAGYVPIFDSDLERQDLINPAPDDGPNAEDMLFPQPWLVRFNQVNPSTGEIRCTKRVRDLLPPGSFFVFARSVRAPAGGPIVFTAGTFQEVLSRSQQPTSTGYYLLQIRRQGAQLWLPSMTASEPEYIYAWVVPPPVERDSKGNFVGFRNKSPVVSVTMRMVE